MWCEGLTGATGLRWPSKTRSRNTKTAVKDVDGSFSLTCQPTQGMSSICSRIRLTVLKWIRLSVLKGKTHFSFIQFHIGVCWVPVRTSEVDSQFKNYQPKSLWFPLRLHLSSYRILWYWVFAKQGHCCVIASLSYIIFELQHYVLYF